MEFGTYLLKSVVILSIFYGVYFIFLRKDTLFTAKRHFLLGGILAALFLPFLEFTRTIYKDTSVVESLPLSDTIPVAVAEVVQSGEAFSVDGWQIILLVYAIGALSLAGRLLIQIYSLIKLLGTYPSEKRKKYTFVRVNEAISPFSFFRYIVYNPASHSEEELQMILKHEQVHVSQWHSVDIILANLARVLQWVNPFSWLYKRSLEENLEFIADNETIGQVPSKKQYQLTLVKASSPVMAPVLTTQFYQSFIKKRIIMLNKSTSKRHNIWKLSLVLPALALFLWSFNVKEVVVFKPSKTVEQPMVQTTGLPQKEALKAEQLTPKLAGQQILDERTTEEYPVLAEATNSSLAQNSSPVLVAAKKAKILNEVVYDLKPDVLKPGKEFKFKITKHTTNAELETIKTRLQQDHGIKFKFSVERNGAQEIIAISLSYKDADGGNGSYNISDDGAIEDFVFYMDEDGDRGFWSEAQEKRHKERLDKRMAKREELLGERMEEREERMEKRLNEQKERLIERKIEMEDRQKLLKERQSDMMAREKDLARAAKEQRVEIERMNNEVAKISSNFEETKTEKEERISSGNGVAVYSSGSKNSGKRIIIDKDTTDEDLRNLKAKLAERRVTFNYSRIKRNEKGQLTRIKITANNGKGSKSTVEEVADDGESIQTIVLKI